MKKIDEALFLVDCDTFDIMWSTLDDDGPDYWYAGDERNMHVHDGQHDGLCERPNCYYVYVKL